MTFFRSYNEAMGDKLYYHTNSKNIDGLLKSKPFDGE